MSEARRRMEALGDTRPSTDVVGFAADGVLCGTHCWLSIAPGPFTHAHQRTSGA